VKEILWATLRLRTVRSMLNSKIILRKILLKLQLPKKIIPLKRQSIIHAAQLQMRKIKFFRKAPLAHQLHR
jgi:hypothetical protein